MRILARNVLWHMVFLGFAVNYMVRINLSIAIVSMVMSRVVDVSAKASECFVVEDEGNTTSLDANSSLLGEPQEQKIVFSWDEYQQGLVLGAFFWLHWALQVPGGVLAHKFGTKRVFGFGNLIMCLMSMLIPAASHLDYRALVVLRVIQGFIGGVCWPSMHKMTASWIPPNERSKFITAYLGSSVGAGLTYPVFGLIIARFGWPAAFHATGIIGIVWFIGWWFLVFDSPAEHPRIDPAERQHIEESLGDSVTKMKPAVPWKSILTSMPVWFTILAHFGGLWGMFLVLIQAPTYFRFIHGWDVRMAGLLSGLPHLCRVIFAIIFSTVGDGLLKRNMIARETLRKFATVVCTVGQSVCIIGLAFCGCNWLAAILCAILATSLHGAVSTGPLAIFVDLSPNYASITYGIAGLIGVIPGFLSPMLVGALTYKNQTIGQWQLAFLISVVIVVLPGILFMFCGSARLQPWNNPQDAGDKLEGDQEKLKPITYQDTRQEGPQETIILSKRKLQN